MTRRQSPEEPESHQQLQNPSRTEICREGLAATNRLYEDLHQYRRSYQRDARTTKKAEKDLRSTVRQLERSTVAYAPRTQRAHLKRDASAYADAMVSPDLDHPAAVYANAELRIRRLELLCLQANLKHGEPWINAIVQSIENFASVTGEWKAILTDVVPA